MMMESWRPLQKMMIFRKNSNQTIDSRLDRLFVYIQWWEHIEITVSYQIISGRTASSTISAKSRMMGPVKMRFFHMKSNIDGATTPRSILVVLTIQRLPEDPVYGKQNTRTMTIQPLTTIQYQLALTSLTKLVTSIITTVITQSFLTKRLNL